MKKSIKVECDSCDGTGLYSGMCEGEGRAVICISCDGQGWHMFSYKVFVKRKNLRGITRIARSAGRSILLGCGPVGPDMTYKEFKKLVPVKYRG